LGVSGHAGKPAMKDKHLNYLIIAGGLLSVYSIYRILTTKYSVTNILKDFSGSNTKWNKKTSLLILEPKFKKYEGQ
jgi:hypothetical protein